jgi:prepilin-type N-terminal cleavage/methylation domain-containing protein
MIRPPGTEEGYTLIETLVAMVLFGIAILPLSGVIATLTESHSAEVLSRALVVGTSELAVQDPDSTAAGTTTGYRDGFLWRRTISEGERILELSVTVAKSPDTSKVLVLLHRSLLIRWKG